MQVQAMQMEEASKGGMVATGTAQAVPGLQAYLDRRADPAADRLRLANLADRRAVVVAALGLVT